MGMTMTQKILAAHAGLESVSAGQLIEADLDLVLANDVTAPVAIHEMEKFNKKQVFDKEKVALVMDHFTPNKDSKAAEQCAQTRRFADKYDIKNLNPRSNPYSKHLKKQITININVEVVDYFKNMAEQSGIPYQTLINLYLMDCAENKRELEMSWK